MKFSINRVALLEALRVTGKCISTSAIVPALTHYRFNIDKNRVAITGGNSEVYLTQEIDINGGDFTRSILIPSNRLVPIINDFPSSIVEFELKKTSLIGDKQNWNVVIYSVIPKRSEYIYPIEDGEEYMSIPVSEETSIKIKSADLFRGIDKTIFACSSDITEILSGLNVRIKGKNLVFIATTGFTLGTRSFDLEEDMGSVSVTIPKKSMDILRSTPSDEDVTLLIRENSVRFLLSDDTSLDTVVFSEAYKDLTEYIPQSNKKTAVAATDSLLRAIKRVSMFCDKINPELVFDFDPDKVVIKARTSTGESAEEEVQLLSFNSGSFRVAFNSVQIVKILGCIDTPEVNIIMAEAGNSVIVCESGVVVSQKRDLMLTAPHRVPEWAN